MIIWFGTDDGTTNTNNLVLYSKECFGQLSIMRMFGAVMDLAVSTPSHVIYIYIDAFLVGDESQKKNPIESMFKHHQEVWYGNVKCLCHTSIIK